MFINSTEQISNFRSVSDGKIEAVSQSEMGYAATVLERCLCRLEDRITNLQNRLVPVIEDRPETVGNKVGEQAERSVYSPIARGIIETAYRIEVAEDRINNLLNKLAI